MPEGDLAERVKRTLARNAELESAERKSADRRTGIELAQKKLLIDSFTELKQLLIVQIDQINNLGMTSQKLAFLPKDYLRLTLDDWFYVTFSGRRLRVGVDTTGDPAMYRTGTLPVIQGKIAILVENSTGRSYHFAFPLRRWLDETLYWGIRWDDRMSIDWWHVASWLLDALMQHDFVARSMNHRNEAILLPPFSREPFFSPPSEPIKPGWQLR
jgi:hypothetical protein